MGMSSETKKTVQETTEMMSTLVPCLNLLIL